MMILNRFNRSWLAVGLTTVVLLLSTELLRAEEVSFTAEAPRSVAVGATFRVTFTVNANGDRFKGPDFKGFDVLSGPNQSTSQSFQMINGSVSQSVTLQYTYLVRASVAGTFEIRPASITVKGKEYRSNSLTIEASAQGGGGAAQGGGQPQAQGRQQRQQNQGDDGTVNPNDVYVRTLVSKTNPSVGEQITVTYKIYTRVGVSNLQITSLPNISGFWSKDLLDSQKQLQQSTETIDGQEYITAEIRKLALFPLKSGEVVIPPIEMTVVAQVRAKKKSRVRDPWFDAFFNDPFFSGSQQAVEVPLKSNAVKVSVRDLPAGKPADFSGAVGNYTLTSTVDRTRLKANEAINLKIVVSGTGNIEMIDKLPITFPPDFDTYDPKVTSSLRGGNSIGGSKTFEYLIIPRNAGQFTINPVNFVYYDLSEGRYKTLTTESYSIEVEKGDGTQASVSYSGVDQQDVQYVGNDIRHIKLPPLALKPAGSHFFGSLNYLLAMSAIVLAAIALQVLVYRRRKAMGNTGLMRYKKATGVARKRLKKAGQFLKSGAENEFYNEISQALWGYLSDKFQIPLSELSTDSVNDALTSRKVNEELIKTFTETLHNCEFARFAPGDKNANMEQIYTQAMEAISRIERELR